MGKRRLEDIIDWEEQPVHTDIDLVESQEVWAPEQSEQLTFEVEDLPAQEVIMKEPEQINLSGVY